MEWLKMIVNIRLLQYGLPALTSLAAVPVLIGLSEHHPSFGILLLPGTILSLVIPGIVHGSHGYAFIVAIVVFNSLLFFAVLFSATTFIMNRMP
jgi:hypothetical protein